MTSTGWLGGKRVVTEVTEALSLRPGASVVIGFDTKLAARFAAAGFDVTFVSDVERDIDRATTTAVAVTKLASLGKDHDGAVIVGGADRDDGFELIGAFGAAVGKTDAQIVLVDRVQRPVAAKAALVGGLSHLDQRMVGRLVLTVGRRNATQYRE